MRRLRTLLALLTLLLPMWAPTQGRPGGDQTVRMIARTLDRLGEKAIAKRLIQDYTQTHRVRFTDLGGDGVNAETGANRQGVNTMDLDESMLKIADLQRLLNVRPYGDSSPLVSAAVTIFHEYQHMDQKSPKNTPKFEDPAWRATDQALTRWIKNLESEWSNLKQAPASPDRTKRLQEVTDLLKRLLAESATLKDGVLANEKNGSLTKGLKWGFDGSATRIRSVLASISKAAPAVAATPKPGKGWLLVEVVDYPLKGEPGNYNITYGRGAIGMGWALGSDVFGFRCSWSEPPKEIRPGDRVSLDLSIAITANAGDQYSANGNFSVWFDHPDVEPGSVIRPVGFRNDKGETGGFDVHHKGAKDGDSASRTVWVDASALGAGGDGAKIALIVCAYNGRNVGTKYIYEWKALP